MVRSGPRSSAPESRATEGGGSAKVERATRRQLPNEFTHWVGLTMLVAIVLASLLASLIAPENPEAQDVSRRLLAPDLSGQHLLGTDALGRDIFSRVLFGGRVSLSVSVGATLLAAMLGVILGLLAGYVGRKVSALILGVADAQLAFPVLLLAIVFAATLGPSLPNIIVILLVSSWVSFARPVHAMTLSLRTREFVVAARSVGGTDGYILNKHLLPHVLPTAVVLATLQVGRLMVLESTLSFLGLGVPIEVPTWGVMLSDARAYIQIAPWISVVPGAAIVLAVLSITLVGDWLQGLMSPRRFGHA